MNVLRSLWFLFLFLCVDVLALGWVRRGKGRGVLVIKNGALGDYLLFRDFLEPLRRDPAFGASTLFLCAPASARQLGEAYDRGMVDAFCWIDYDAFVSKPFYRFRILKGIKETGFRAALASGYNREFMWDDALIRASGAAERIGRLPGPVHARRFARSGAVSYRPSLFLAWGNRFYTRLLPGEPEPCFEFLQNASFFRALLGEAPLPSSPRLAPLPVALPELPERFALFFPGAGSRIREWPTAHFAALARELWREWGMKIVLAGVSRDRGLARPIREAAPEVPFFDLTGNLDQVQLVAVVARAALVVGGDSAGIHLAAATGVPGIGLAKGSFLGRFHPYPLNLAPRIRFVYPPPMQENLDAFMKREASRGASPLSIAEIAPAAVLQVARELLAS